MRLAVRIASWPQHVVVQFEDSYELLGELGLDGHLDILKMDGKIYVMPDAKGFKITKSRERTPAPWDHELDFKSWSKRGDVRGVDIPYFGTFETEAIYDDGCLVIDLPPSHRLPWLKTHCSLDEEEWAETIERKLRSAARHKEKLLRMSELMNKRIGYIYRRVFHKLKTEGVL